MAIDRCRVAIAMFALRTPVWLGFLLSGVLLGGCAAVPAEDGMASKSTPAESPEAGEGGSSFSRDTLYRLLVAEIAGRQGDPGLSLRNYLEVAKERADPEAAKRAVEIALSAGDTEGGLEAVRLWAELAPESREAEEVHAVFLIRAGALDEAVEVLRGVVDARDSDAPGQGLPRVSEILMREAEGSRSSARIDRASALRVMAMLIAERRNDPDALFVFGHLLVRFGEFERAERAFERVLAIQPDNEHATVLLARIHQQRRDLPRALAVLERALGQKPESNTLLMTYARLLVDAQRFDEARMHFERLLEKDENNEDVRYALALLLFQLRDFDRAENEFRVLTRSIERRDGAWYYIGRVAESHGDYEGALTAYSKVVRGDNRLNAQVRVAVLLSEADRVDEARARLHALQGRNASEAMRLYSVEADILLHHSRFDEAMQVYDAALEEWPGDTNLLYARAMLAVELDDLAAAERDFGTVIERNPDHADALNALGYTLADRTDRIEEAYRLIKRAYELEPDSHYIVDSMGWVMFRMGRHEEALQLLRHAMELGSDPEVAAHLGEVLWVTGDREAAREVWGNALESTPDDEKLLDIKQRFGLQP